MISRAMQLMVVVLLCSHCTGPASVSKISWSPDLTQRIPTRQQYSLTGSQFADRVAGMDSRQREQAICDELLRGNLPEFLRQLAPVHLVHTLPNGKKIHATIFVMPDYLAIGSDRDFLRIPMGFHTAMVVAAQFGFVLPTTKMVDAIYEQSAYRYEPQPMAPGPEMRSTEYYRIHDQMIEAQGQASGFWLGKLVAGHKKDVVVTNRLVAEPGKVAIYGWHRHCGDPIQPLSTVHGFRYADYSHGIRLVSDIVLIDGKYESIYRILEDPMLADVLSDEGAIGSIEQFVGLRAS